mmetsp:Transcript_108916/g.308024  ORF Transcript_108916/g.308024 Transcript_108916/m.308024 type:complete len:686 (+) Transcript_108916:3-2060(+)
MWQGIWLGLWAHRQHLQSVPKQSAVLGLIIYRFRQNVINVVQIAIADEHRGRGLGKKAVEWLVQYARKFNMDSVAVGSTQEGLKFYESCGLRKQLGRATLDGEDHVEGLTLMEYRLTPSAFELALKRASEGSPVPREELAPAVFSLLDKDGDGRLNQAEMRNFANRIGFTGSDEEWAEEYAKVLQAAAGAGDERPPEGVEQALFMRLVNDRSDEGCFCTDEELRTMAVKLMPKPDSGTSAAAAPAPMTRKELIAAVFRMCDRDGDGLLASAELRTFASHTGFDGDDAAWAEEYSNLCAEVAADPALGVSLAAFSNLVDDDSESGCFCADAELHNMLQTMKADRISEEANFKADGAAAAPAQASAARAGDIQAIFSLVNLSGNGFLNEEETRTFAGLTGYQGSAAQWKEDYRHLCSDLGMDFTKGVNPDAFCRLINDSSEGGLYCSDEELQSIRQKLEDAARLGTDGERAKLIRSVFEGCDFDRDGCLNEQEMRVISNHLGFEGKDEEWTDEFGLLCRDNHADPARGVDLVLAERLLNDRTDSGCYCSDEELRSLLAKLEDPDAKAKLLPRPRPAQAGPQDAGPKASLRKDLVAAVFRACDVDKDGVLSEKEMRGFARHTGFEGTAEEWANEYRSLCADSKTAGVDAELFEKLVDDTSSGGCYCTYDELKAILDKVRIEIKDAVPD